ncbi:hypothetical protein SDC9_102200 [bioreactor metagenome]|uniref:Citrate transporter-like domain-containing protein n=1 Tax=bioreactor metagenome TaxID=1076179 RepID=A0A645AWW9_9ZZZZ
MVGIIGLILAIVVMIVGAYKGLGALPLTILAALVVIIFNQMPIWDTYSGIYIAGYTGTYTGYFLIFIFSALYAKIMDTSGSTTAIGYKLIDWFGKKRVILVSVLITSVLTYGGVSLFVCVFAVGPIMFLLFKEANLPRHLTAACLVIGAATYTMTALPGTPQLTNVIPTQFLGTKMTAAPVLSILCAAALFVLCMIYVNRAEKKALAANETWTYPAGVDHAMYEVRDRSVLPAAWKAFTPMVALIIFIIAGSQYIKSSAMLTVLAMLLGSVLALVLNLDKFKTVNMIKLFTTGLGDGISAIGGLAAVVAFGTVVSNSPAFTSVVKWVLSFNMHPYWMGIFSTAIISGITGSSSGGLRITLQALGENFVASGCNLNILHRLMSVAAGSLDSLPHSSGLFLIMGYLGLTHKESYRHIFFTTVAIPAVVVVVATLVCVTMGL